AQQNVVLLVVDCTNTRANQCHVVQRRYRVRLCILGVDTTVELTGVVTDLRRGNREPELAFTTEAFIVVKGVIATENGCQIFCVDRASEKLETIVKVVEHFDMLDGCAATDTTHAQTVDLVVCTNQSSAVADRDVK